MAWKNATGISRKGTTVTVTVNNNFVVNQWVSVQGVTQPAYDGWFQVTSRSSTQFTYSVPVLGDLDAFGQSQSVPG